MTDEPDPPIPFELVGGPKDGEIVFLKAGVLTVGFPIDGQFYQYVREGNKLVFTPIGIPPKRT